MRSKRSLPSRFVQSFFFLLIIAMFSLASQAAAAAKPSGDGPPSPVSIHRESSDNPDSMAMRKDLAWALEQSGDLTGAEKVYRALVDSGKADEETRVRFGWLLNRQQRYEEAWFVIAPLPRPNPGANVLELQARTAFWSRRMAEAVPLYEALLVAKPGIPQLEQEYRAALQALEPPKASGRMETARTPGSLREPLTHPLNQDLRLARLHRKAGRLAQAADHYRKFLSGAKPSGEFWQARAEYAQVLMDSGHPEASYDEILPVADRLPRSPDVLLTAARASSQSGRPQQAVDYLERLSRLKPLSFEQRIWLAGQYRAAGQRETALTLYEKLLVNQTAPPMEILESIGDLRLDTGDSKGAMEAYGRICTQPEPRRYEDCPPHVILKIARAAAASHEDMTARGAYSAYCLLRPEESDASLEAARYLSSIGEAREALEHYENVASRRGSEGLRLELARACLAAEHFHCGERYAREALDHQEGDRREARLLLGQSLLSRGEAMQSMEEFQTLRRDHPTDPEVHAWLAQAAAALDCHRQAYEEFGRAMDLGAPDRADLSLLQGRSASRRMDYARAMSSYDAARKAGAESRLVDQGEAVVREATPVTLGGAFMAYGDSNDVHLEQGGVTGSFWVKKAAQLTLQVMRGRLDQHETSYDRTVGRLAWDHLFLSPALETHGFLGVEAFDGEGSTFTGQWGLKYTFLDSSQAGFALNRETFWSVQDLRDPRQYNRIIRLDLLPPDFILQGGSVFLDKVFLPSHAHWFVRAGGESYDGESERFFGYSHFQIPLKESDKFWLAVKPNVYFESFQDESPAYFSPSSHFSLGTLIHSIVRQPNWNFEAEVNPQMLMTEGNAGFGIMGAADLNVNLGPCWLGVGAFTFYDQPEEYWSWRVVATLSRRF